MRPPDELTVGYVDIDRNIPKSKGPYMYCLNNATGVDGYQFNRSLPAYQKAACPTWDIPLPGNVTFCPSEQVCMGWEQGGDVTHPARSRGWGCGAMGGWGSCP